MPEDAPDEPNKATGKPVLLSGKATATSKSYGYMHVRLIHPSPATDPKLLKQARKVARELKEKREAEKRKSASYAKKSPATDPKLLKQAQKLALELKKKRGSAVGKNETGSYAKKSLSLFPVK